MLVRCVAKLQPAYVTGHGKRHLSVEGDRLLAQRLRVADVGEDDLAARLAQVLGGQVQLTAHRVLAPAEVLIQQICAASNGGVMCRVAGSFTGITNDASEPLLRSFAA